MMIAIISPGLARARSEARHAGLAHVEVAAARAAKEGAFGLTEIADVGAQRPGVGGARLCDLRTPTHAHPRAHPTHPHAQSIEEAAPRIHML